jgi:hypothetical protein
MLLDNFKDKLTLFWLKYEYAIVLLTIMVTILVFLLMVDYALLKHGINWHHVFSSEANRYEHLNELIGV